MKTIVMDTSNIYLVIALYEDGQCIDKYQEKGNRNIILQIIGKK